MFHMMNEARISVGLSAAAIGYTGYLHSLDYAKTRLQGRTRGDRSPSSEQVPIIRHADVRRMLLAQKAYVSGALALCLYASRLSDDMHSQEDANDREEAHGLLDLLTPSSRAGRPNGVSSPTISPFRFMAATVTRANTTSSSSIATIGSTRYTKAHSVSRRSTCWVERRVQTAAPR